MRGLVELDRALGILAEHAVDDADVGMEVRIKKRAETRKQALSYSPVHRETHPATADG